MTIQQLRVDQIRCGPRQRQIDAGKVEDIAASIEQHGLLQAIGVRALLDHPGHFDMVFGAHRLAAMIMLERETIAAYVLPTDLSEEEYRLMELQENCARNDLTGAQRKGFSAEMGRLITKIAENSDVTTRNNNWLLELVKTSNTPQATLYDWWHTFCQDTGLSKTPRQATEADKQHFFDWMDDQERQEDEAKQQQAAARKRRIQQEECESAVSHLANLAQAYGVEVVDTQVIVVFKERFGRTSHA